MHTERVGQFKGARCCNDAPFEPPCVTLSAVEQESRIAKFEVLLSSALASARELAATDERRLDALFNHIQRGIEVSKTVASIAQARAPSKRKAGGSRNAPYKQFGTSQRTRADK